ncbi:MAG TPA: SUMF1/EgtB/PvdO family nonheme iron enzyme, partial [Myxococcota bacterium]|nr:SUMF1/EgtB/PvdO family nonheme iron enzyme [Myxococcota bacterium]
ETGEMKLVASGSFWMGCNSAVDTQCENDEKPYHKVTLSAYYMDMTEVTQSEYKKCIDAGECDTPPCDWDPSEMPNRPVVCVNWSQAGEYCAWAGKRLPTEAEWEKAARGTDGRKYPWGNEDATCEYAVMYDGTDYSCGTNSTWDVCSKSPAGDSPYGLCDMSGNVWEWVSDWYDFRYYTNSPASNPTGPVSGSYRIFRGGCFDYSAGNLRASYRYAHYNPSAAIALVGFRCARSQ